MKTICRILVFPIILILLAGTAFIEYLSESPDWKYWKEFNSGIIQLLPFRFITP